MDSTTFDNGPAMLPPAGIRSNFVDPYSEAYMARATGIAFLVLATTFVVARLFTKLRIIRKVDLEDCSTDLALYLALLTNGRRPCHCLGLLKLPLT